MKPHTTKTEALRKARDQFADYARQHHAKGTEDGTRKARVNEDMAAMCEAALGAGDSEQPFLDQAIFMAACGQKVSSHDPVQAAMYRKLIDEEFTELTDAEAIDDEVETADAVMDLLVVLIGFAISKGWPVDALWAEVIRSNMAKVDPETGKVRRREDGKVLKPEGWTPPDIAGVLRAHGVIR